jgi:N-acetylglucosaminyl-diphospho-decaprenol L-rhamnosyltransferase
MISSFTDNQMSEKCTVILPTFFPGEQIVKCIETVPKIFKIVIIDNSYDDRLIKFIKKYNNIEYHNIGDVGLGKTFNYALSIIKTELIFLTQPDVTLRSNCLENLINSTLLYPSAGILSPIVFDNGIYSKYDFYDLKYDKINKVFNNKKFKDGINIVPSGDYSVDAINATSMLLNTNLMKTIGGWDNNIYVYLEDIDISLRLKLNGNEIIKVRSAEVDHKGFSSHFLEIKDTMNLSRIWHFTWSSIYFKKKFCNQYVFILSIAKVIFVALVKNIFHLFFFNPKKFIINNIKISACVSHILNKGSYFRSKHQI